MVRKGSVLPGQRYGRLVVLSYSHTKKYACQSYHKFYVCHCDCGTDKTYNANNLRKGHTRSCGCWRSEETVARLTTHNQSGKRNPRGTRTYQIWQGILKRCNNKNCKQYFSYGGRGIRVCQRWIVFQNFLDDMGDIPSPLSVDRIDPNGDYSPDNCRLATPKEQANNKRPYILEGTAVRITSAQKPSRTIPFEKHGKCSSKVYQVWAEMHQRCQNSRHKSYNYYGGRGISVCDRWLYFSAFLEDMGEPTPGLCLGRIDVNGNYCPENCRWATRSEQRQNQRRKIYTGNK